ncbi:hypothetical protein P8452_29317 [Trifolium repens]|nr:hypothetical protein P8452_29317 [Trifolium repens]
MLELRTRPRTNSFTDNANPIIQPAVAGRKTDTLSLPQPFIGGNSRTRSFPLNSEKIVNRETTQEALLVKKVTRS